MQNIKQLIKEFRESRNATFIKGELRYDKDCDLVCEASSGVPNSVKVIASSSGETVIMDEDAAFFCYSTNNITKLLDAMEILVEAIEDTIDSGYDQAGHCASAIQLAEEKVSGKEL